MNDAEATVAMSQALTSAGITFNPSEAESAHMGIAFTPPAATIPATPAPAAAAPKPQTPEQMIAALNAPNLGNDGVDATIAGAFNNAPANPGHYDFRPADGRSVDPAIDGPMRALMHAEGWSKGLGDEVARQWNKAAANPPSADQLATQQATTMAELTRSGNAQETIRLARSEVDRLEARSPGVKAMLEASGLGNNVWLVRTLAARAMARKP